jgi:hypothetical protein
MLNSLRRWFGHPGTALSRAPVKPARVDALEKRTLMSIETLVHPPASAAEAGDMTPPTLVNEQLIGTDPRAVEGIVLTFSEPLDPATVSNPRTYRVGRRTDRRQRFDVDFNNDNDRFRRGLVRFEDPVYDAATNTVTLNAIVPFNITRRFRTIRVLSRVGGTLAIKDLAGNLLDGNNDGKPGGDAVEQFTFRRGRHITYGERDGDNVSLSLTGPGRLWVIRQTEDGDVLARGDARRVYIENADPARSILTGKVSGRGNGVAVIEQLVGTSTAQVQIATDPAFQIVTSIP